MNKENKLIPELRFPEFQNELEWDDKVLGEICDVRDGTHDSPKYVSEGFPLITSKNLLENGEMDFDNVSYLSKYDYDKINERSKVDINDILFGMIGTIGNPVIVKRDGFAIKNVALIKTKGELKQEYLIQLMKSDYIDKQFQKANAGGILKFIALGMIRKLNIPTPQPQEQQKIASCLSSLDELLTAHNDKLEALKNHKKGLMQNLFPQEGETVPKVRFSEFEGDGEWMENKLGGVAELTSSKRVHLADYVESGIPFFRGKEISELKKGIIPSDILYISEEQYYEIKDKYEVPKVGDILITAVGTLGNVYRITTDSKFYFKDGNLIWMKNISVSSSFLEILLDARKSDVLLTAIGSSQKALTMKALNKLILSFPKNPKEQQKIASCLSALDELISAQTEKIEQLKEHKKGLMQGLFPKIIEHR
ncbi:MAG TPA: restriction endonuclease subunit S [Chitinophagales bacterium]|nr:restriction endonuclease subunit S [Chitinophagales bacterium]